MKELIDKLSGTVALSPEGLPLDKIARRMNMEDPAEGESFFWPTRIPFKKTKRVNGTTCVAASFTGTPWKGNATNPECYGPYLEERGCIRHKSPIHPNRKRYRFWEFAKSFNGRAFCGYNKAAHVTCLADNTIWDIWNVSGEIVGVYWSKD